MNQGDVRDLTFMLLGLGTLTISLYEIFDLLAKVYLDLQMAVAALVLVSTLLILGYALGFLAISTVVLPVIVMIWRRRERNAAT